jgi:hypothetical protein
MASTFSATSNVWFAKCLESGTCMAPKEVAGTPIELGTSPRCGYMLPRPEQNFRSLRTLVSKRGGRADKSTQYKDGNKTYNTGPTWRSSS